MGCMRTAMALLRCCGHSARCRRTHHTVMMIQSEATMVDRFFSIVILPMSPLRAGILQEFPDEILITFSLRLHYVLMTASRHEQETPGNARMWGIRAHQASGRYKMAVFSHLAPLFLSLLLIPKYSISVTFFHSPSPSIKEPFLYQGTITRTILTSKKSN